MAINKKFIHFKRKSTFQRELEAGNILNTSIVFIADAKLIYLNGSYFSENTLFNLSDLLSTVSGDLTDTDTSNEAIVKLYKYLKEVDSNTDSLIKVLMLEVSTLEETLTNRINSTDLLVATELSNINQRLNTSENEITRLSESFKETDSITKILVEEVPSIEETLTNRIDNTDLLVATELGNINLKLENLINITYSELKSLRDSSKLVPGRWYRITDYECTTSTSGTRSAGHLFDIVVLALSNNSLSEEARAIQHEEDTYFANSDLLAWKVWYTIDNDNTKYSWADTVNGKGVIYRMIDEWGNDCPYDFKNVQFKRYWANGVNTAKTGEPENIILQGYYGTLSNAGTFTEGIDTDDYLFLFTFTRLNNILIHYEKGSVTQSNVLDESIQTEGFDTNCCHNNILKPAAIDNTAFILLNNVFITVKTINSDNNEVYLSPSTNTLGINCINNSFGNACSKNIFGNSCSDNIFGNSCKTNSFGNSCSKNIFDNLYLNNIFGNSGSSNTFGQNCHNNSFGNSCNNNSFRGSFQYNTFGNNCDKNTFNGVSINNSFGNSCSNNTFGNYFQYNTLGNYIQYVEIATAQVYNTHVLNGTKGTSSKKLTIEFIPRAKYSQFAGLTSDNVLEIWTEADAPVSTINLTYNELKELRDNSNLKPSQYYRITDFVTTVANDQKAQSAGHPFDIIVLALDKNKLQEECLAIQHTGDSYFANNNLSAWRVWYCLDNDTTRFTWADSTNGKGVIYRLIDEFGNECPYDFKNILFARWLCEDTVNGDMFEELDNLYLYWNTKVESGFTLNKVTPISVDSTLRKFLYTFSTTSDTDNSLNSTSCRDNVITANSQYPISLSNIVIIGTATNNVLYKCSNISALEGFTRNRLDTCTNIIIGKAFDLNKIGVNSSYLIFGNSCSYNDFGRDCNYSHFFKSLWGNVFNASSYYFNSFGPNFAENVLGISCGANKFEAGCGGNFLYADCEGNTFKENSSNNILYRNCDGLVINGSYNKFGAFCSSITINGNGNKFGDTCSNMTFPSLLCNENSFGDNCSNNTFKNYLSYNKFGNGFSSNTIGTSVLSGAEYNTFGDNISSVTIGNKFKNNTVNNFLLLVTIGDNISNTVIFLEGQLNNITLDITPNANYLLYVAKTSSGLIKVWNPADLNVIAE